MPPTPAGPSVGLSPELVALCEDLALQPDGLTCFATSIGNGASCIGRKVDHRHVIKLLSERDIARPDNMGVTNAKAAIQAIDSYLNEQSVRAEVEPRLSARDIRKLAEGDRTLPWPVAVCVAMNEQYMARFHDLEENVPEDPFEAIKWDGPAHDVLLLAATKDHVWLYDPEPALNVVGAGTPGAAHVVKLKVAEFDAYVTAGTHSRESVRLTVRQAVKGKTDEPKPRPATERKLTPEGTP